MRHLRSLLAGCAMVGLLAQTAAAQIDPLGGLNFGGAAASQDPISITAEIQVLGADKPVVAVTAQIANGYHIYSVTQPKGGPIKTTISLEPSNDFRVVGDPRPLEQPHQSISPEFNNITVETHEGRVTWHIPIEPAANIGAEKVRVFGKLNAMACNDMGCLPPRDYSFSAVWKGTATLALPAPTASTTTAPSNDAKTANSLANSGVFQYGMNQPTIRGHVEPSTAPPGGKVRLSLTVEPAKDWHVYAMQSGTVSQPTVINLSHTDGWTSGPPAADHQPKLKSVAGSKTPDQVYERAVTWTVEVRVPQTAPAGEHTISGLIGYQTCNAGSCMPPAAAAFSANVTVAAGAGSGRVPLTFTSAAYPKTNPAETASILDPKNFVVAANEAVSRMPMWQAMLLGFAGGLILNLMPCVLPVIGLKILSFVEQSGHDRRRILMLNVWYSAGLLSVFMVLAGLAAFAGLGWGQLFSYTAFNVTMAACVFAMGLSFLGVWEIPIPGFVGGESVGNLAQQEGASGAFAKGVITTILATPCSGPFLGTALVWAVAQPAYLTFAVFAMIGLGMASPYLAIGMFPSLIRLLPKPGMWMETFKQIMGFVLLATVVYVLTFIPWEYVVPTVALLIGVWAGCWWLGRTPGTAELNQKVKAWTIAGAIVAATAIVAFVGLNLHPRYGFGSLHSVMLSRYQRDVEQQIAKNLSQPAGPKMSDGVELAWQPFSVNTLKQLTSERKTVLVDFTADWCLTCKTLEAAILNTEDMRKLVDANQIVTLQADWTDGSPEITNMLTALGSKQVPVIAIFPAGRPNEPIVFRGAYTRQELFDAINGLGSPQQVTVSDPPPASTSGSVQASLMSRR